MAKDEPAIVRLVEDRPKLPKNVALAYVILKDWAAENGYRVALYRISRGRK